MRKLLFGCALTGMMAMASVCAAAGDGNALNKEQKIAEVLHAGLMNKAETTYDSATQGMLPELKAKITEQVYAGLQKSMKETYGAEKSVRFETFVRSEKNDLLVYVGSFAKHEIVAMQYVFTKDGKLQSMNYGPVQKPAPAQEAPAQEAPAQAE